MVKFEVDATKLIGVVSMPQSCILFSTGIKTRHLLVEDVLKTYICALPSCIDR